MSVQIQSYVFSCGNDEIIGCDIAGQHNVYMLGCIAHDGLQVCSCRDGICSVLIILGAVAVLFYGCLRCNNGYTEDELGSAVVVL